jgi:galactose mutarotase-like enzyme
MDHTISDGGITAVIRAQGAELRSLRDPQGPEYIWQAGPAWPRCAPVLFLIVGRLMDDRLRHGGQTYRLTQHGFARERAFDWLDRRVDACRLTLVDAAETRAMYPFAFRLELDYAVADGELAMTFTVANTGAEALPASFGAHPGFNWPLRPDTPPEAYALTFAHDEPAPIRRRPGIVTSPLGLSNAVSHRQERTEPSGDRRRRYGTKSSPRRESNVLAYLPHAQFGNVTKPSSELVGSRHAKLRRRFYPDALVRSDPVRA